MGTPAHRAHSGCHAHIGGGIAEIAVDVAKQAEHLRRCLARRVDVIEFQRLHGVGPELVQAPAAVGDADDRDAQHAALDEPDQGRERLELGEIPGGAEDDQRVHAVSRHGRSLRVACR